MVLKYNATKPENRIKIKPSSFIKFQSSNCVESGSEDDSDGESEGAVEDASKYEGAGES